MAQTVTFARNAGKRKLCRKRSYRAFGYPELPALYLMGASGIMVVLLFYKTQTIWSRLLMVLAGVSVYFW